MTKKNQDIKESDKKIIKAVNTFYYINNDTNKLSKIRFILKLESLGTIDNIKGYKIIKRFRENRSVKYINVNKINNNRKFVIDNVFISGEIYINKKTSECIVCQSLYNDKTKYGSATQILNKHGNKWTGVNIYTDGLTGEGAMNKFYFLK